MILIKERVNNIGVKHKKIAELMNIDNAYLSQLLNEDRPFPKHQLEKLEIILTEYEKANERLHATQR